MLAATSTTNLNTSLPTSTNLQIDDILVFIVLESLGALAITGNVCLIAVLLRNSYLRRASFILMLSLAIADVIHGIVTTLYFYPPILLKRNHMPPLGVRVFNILDWSAWAITLTHMSAICLDRLIAIMLYGRYNLIVTVKRIRLFTLFCWTLFLSINTLFIFALKACCLITPLESNQFYTFGYGEFESNDEKQRSIFNGLNLFTFTYSPLELTTLTILSISNPTTLIQLYRRHKRKIALRIQTPSASRQTDNSLKTRSQWQRASTMLLEMSMRMGSKHINEDVRNLASRRANRQQQRILLQISVVACLFYSYMLTYYLLYHVFVIENKWVVLFNSLFYSTTHMINPVIYFSLNKEMRIQLIKVLSDCLSAICCIKMSATDDLERKPSTEPRSSTKGAENSVTINETSPLFNANNIRPTLLVSTNAGVEKMKISEFSASLKRLVHHNNSTILTKISVNSTTDEIVDSSGIDDLDMKNLANGCIRNEKINGHKNSGFIDSNEPNSNQSKLTDETEETRLLLEENENENGNNEQSLLRSVVKAMHRIVLFDNSAPTNRIPNSRSLDQLVKHTQRRMSLSHTIHAIEKDNQKRSPDDLTESDANFLKSSLVLLINENNSTITTVHELDSQESRYTRSETPEDEIIFL